MQLCHGVGPSCYSPWFARMMRIFMESCVDILSSLTKRCEHCDLFVAFINIAAIVLSPFAPWNQMLMIVRSLGESKGWDPWRLLKTYNINISIYFRSTEWGKHVWNIQKAKGFLSKIPSRFLGFSLMISDFAVEFATFGFVVLHGFTSAQKQALKSCCCSSSHCCNKLLLAIEQLGSRKCFDTDWQMVALCRVHWFQADLVCLGGEQFANLRFWHVRYWPKNMHGGWRSYDTKTGFGTVSVPHRMKNSQRIWWFFKLLRDLSVSQPAYQPKSFSRSGIPKLWR